MAWSRKYCLGSAEITSFGFLVLFKDAERRLSLSFIFLFLMLIKEREGWCGFKILLRDPRMETFSFRFSRSC